MSPRVPSIFRRIVQGRGTFATSEDGTVLVLWAMFLAVALGFLALSFDLGRVAATQSELQSYADQVALAAAGELDGRSDAITRATAAASGLVSDRQTYATGANALAGAGNYTLTFLRTLPTDDRAAATATTTNPALARYVRVQVLDRSVVTGFAGANATLTGRAGTNAQVNVAATATAGMTSWACDVTPLMFCVPDTNWRATNNIGDLIQLRSGGGSSQWGPGNFGFLDVTSLAVDTSGPCNGLNSAQLYRCLVGAERGITSCIRTDAGVDTKPGQQQGLALAFNYRFDIYNGAQANQRQSDPNYRPALNTLQGTRPNGSSTCRNNNPPNSNAMALPRDNCMIAGNCSCPSGVSGADCNRFGNGNWNRAAYVATNHGGVYPAGTNASSSRYRMYLAEIAAARLRTSPNNVPAPGRNETGSPMCHTLGPSSNPDRRTVIAAAVDCNTQEVSGNSRGIVPLEYVKVFMIAPVQGGGQGGGNDTDPFDILVEVVDTAGGVGSGAITGIYNDFVQLYR